MEASKEVSRKWRVEKAQQERQQEEQRKREEYQQREALRQQEEDVSNRRYALSGIADMVSYAQLSAAKLPLLMSEAELSLDLAEREFSEGFYSPFWEAMESAVYHLSLFDKTLQNIDAFQKQHTILIDECQRQYSQAPSLAPEDIVSFSLGITVFPSPSVTSERMKALYRQAQKDPHFAQIYEQRRTNAILIEGFRSLGDALTHLGDRLESELRSLGDTIDFRLSDLESALQDSNKQMGKQHEELLQSAQSWREEARSGNAKLIQIARSNAEQAEKSAKERSEHEEATRKMLDNIQHHRKPLLWE